MAGLSFQVNAFQNNAFETEESLDIFINVFDSSALTEDLPIFVEVGSINIDKSDSTVVAESISGFTFWKELYYTALTGNTSASFGNNTLREVLLSPYRASYAANRIRIRYSFYNLSTLSGTYVGLGSMSGDVYDFESAPTQVLFDGSATSPSSMSFVSDIVDFAVDPAKPLTVSLRGSPFYIQACGFETVSVWYKNANDLTTVDATGYNAFTYNPVTNVYAIDPPALGDTEYNNRFVFSQLLGYTSNSLAGTYNIRNYIPAGVIPNLSQFVIQLGQVFGATISNIWIGNSDGVNDYYFSGDQIQVTINGSTSHTFNTYSLCTTDPIVYNYDTSKNLVVSYTLNLSSYVSLGATGNGGGQYGNVSAPNSTSWLSGSNLSNGPANILAVLYDYTRWDTVTVSESVTAVVLPLDSDYSVYDSVACSEDVVLEITTPVENELDVNRYDDVAVTESSAVTTQQLVSDISVYDAVATQEFADAYWGYGTQIYSSELSGVQNFTNGYTVRTVFPASRLSAGAHKIRVLVSSSTLYYAWADSFVLGKQAASGDVYDFDGNQQVIGFGGDIVRLSNGPVQERWSQEITLDLDTTGNLVAAIYQPTLTGQSADSTQYSGYYKSGSDCLTTNASGYDQWDAAMGKVPIIKAIYAVLIKPPVSAYDTTTVSENVTVAVQELILDVDINISDTVAAQESVALSIDQYVSIFDTCSVSESVVTELNSFISVYDSTTAADVNTVDRIENVANIDLSDTIAVVDYSVIQFNLTTSVFDSVTGQDEAFVLFPEIGAINVAVEDLVTITESISANTSAAIVSVFDSAGIVDAVYVLCSLSVVAYTGISVTDIGTVYKEDLVSAIAVWDTVQVAESVEFSGTLFVEISDILSVLEYCAAIVPFCDLTVFDQVTIEDVGYPAADGAPLNAETSETVSVQDLGAAALSDLELSVAEVTLLSEATISEVSALILSVVDACSVSENVVVFREVQGEFLAQDSVSVAETVSLAVSELILSVFDAVLLSEQVNVAEVVCPTTYDDISVSEYVSSITSGLSISKYESITISEYVGTKSDGVVVAADAVSVIDSLAVRTDLNINVIDSAALSEDVISRTEYNVLSTDAVIVTENVQPDAGHHYVNVREEVVVRDSGRALWIMATGLLILDVDILIPIVGTEIITPEVDIDAMLPSTEVTHLHPECHVAVLQPTADIEATNG